MGKFTRTPKCHTVWIPCTLKHFSWFLSSEYINRENHLPDYCYRLIEATWMRVLKFFVLKKAMYVVRICTKCTFLDSRMKRAAIIGEAIGEYILFLLVDTPFNICGNDTDYKLIYEKLTAINEMEVASFCVRIFRPHLLSSMFWIVSIYVLMFILKKVALALQRL